jgi:hypothetical protein
MSYKEDEVGSLVVHRSHQCHCSRGGQGLLKDPPDLVNPENIHINMGEDALIRVEVFYHQFFFDMNSEIISDEIRYWKAIPKELSTRMSSLGTGSLRYITEHLRYLTIALYLMIPIVPTSLLYQKISSDKMVIIRYLKCSAVYLDGPVPNSDILLRFSFSIAWQYGVLSLITYY